MADPQSQPTQSTQAPGPQTVNPTVLGRSTDPVRPSDTTRIDVTPPTQTGQAAPPVQFGGNNDVDREYIIREETARIETDIVAPITDEFEKLKEPLKRKGSMMGDSGIYMPAPGDYLSASSLKMPGKLDLDFSMRSVLYNMGNYLPTATANPINIPGGEVATKFQEWFDETSGKFTENARAVAEAEYQAAVRQAQALNAFEWYQYSQALAESKKLTKEEQETIDFYNKSGAGGVFGAANEFKSADYTPEGFQRAQTELGQAVGEFKAYSRTQANMGDIENWNKMVDDLVTKSDVKIDPSDHYAYDKFRVAAAAEKASFQAAEKQIHADAYLPDWVYEARQEGRQAVLEGKSAGSLQDFGNLFTPEAYQARFDQYQPKPGTMDISKFISGSTTAAARFMGEGQNVQSRSVVYLNEQPYFYTSYGKRGYELRDTTGQIRSAGSGDIPLEQIRQEINKVRDSPKSRVISPTLNVLYSDVRERYPTGEPGGIISSYDALFYPERGVQVGVGALSRYTDTGVSTVAGAQSVIDIANRLSVINTHDRDLQSSLNDIRGSMQGFISQHPGVTTTDERATDIATKRALLAPSLFGIAQGNPLLRGFAGDVAQAGGESLARLWRQMEHPEEYGKGAFGDYSITLPIFSHIGEKREKVTSGSAFSPLTTAITTGWDQFVRAHAVQLPVSVREGGRQFVRAHEPITRDATHLGKEVYEGVSAIPFGVAGFVASIPTGIEYVGSKTVTGGIPGGIGAVKTGGKTVVDSTMKAFSEKPIATAIEMYGTGKVLTPVFKASPVKPAIHTAKFGDTSFYSLGLMKSVGKVDTAIPLVGLRTVSKPKLTTTTTPPKPSHYPVGDYYPTTLPSEPRIGVFVGHPKAGSAVDKLEVPVEFLNPFETEIVARAVPEERLKLDLARAIRTETQHSGLRPHDMRNVVEEVVQSHNIPNHKGVADTILKALVEDESTVYGSIVQRQVGAETGRVGLLRVPRDIDAMVTSIDDFGALIVRRINQRAGREVVEFEDGAVIVKKSGEKLFDLHAKDALDTTTPGGSSKWIGLGIQTENPVKIGYRFADGTRGHLTTTTLSEQATRKAVGSAFTVSSKPRVMRTESTGTVKGRIMPEKEGRLKDIGDYYTAERLNLAKMGMKKGGQRQVKEVDDKLELWLESWGSDVTTNVRAQYADAMTTTGGKTTLASFSRPTSASLPALPRVLVPTTSVSPSRSPVRSILSRSPRIAVPRSPMISASLARSPSRVVSRVVSPSRSPSPSPSRSRSPSPSPVRSPSVSLSPSRSPSPSPIRSPSISLSLSRSPSPSSSPSRSPSPSPSPSRSQSRSPSRSPSQSPSRSPSPSPMIRSPSPSLPMPKKSRFTDKRSKSKRGGMFSTIRTEWDIATPEVTFFGGKKRKGNKYSLGGV